MTLNEAITHCEARASSDCSECAKQHKQLAGWLKELKGRRKWGWIPMENATPDEQQEILATDGKYVYLVEYDSDYGYGEMDDITAWMLLPEPYKPEKIKN